METSKKKVVSMFKIALSFYIFVWVYVMFLKYEEYFQTKKKLENVKKNIDRNFREFNRLQTRGIK